MALDKIIVENFKAFKGEHIFDLRQLNIFTGANNSGKSTLIKAISLFSKGLEKGDFPSIDLFETDSGSFKDLVNRDSGADNFKIGFFIEVGEKKAPFKVMYEFVEEDEHDFSGVVFRSLKIITPKGNELLGLYNIYKFKLTENNIEFMPDDSEIENLSFPYITPAEGGDHCLMVQKINLIELENYLNIKKEKGFDKLLNTLKNIQTLKGNWWSEALMEYDFDYKLDNISFSDLQNDLYVDHLFNIGDYNTRYIEYYGGEDILNSRDTYIELRESSKYRNLLMNIIFPIFNEVKNSLKIFNRINIKHLQYMSFSDRIIRLKHFDEKINVSPLNGDGVSGFSRDALRIFNIDGFIDIRFINNSFIEIYLTTGITDFDNEFDRNLDLDIQEANELKPEGSKLEFDKFQMVFLNLGEKYKECKSENVFDLGKGLKNLVFLIISVYSAIESFKYEKIVSDSKSKYSKEKSEGKRKLLILEEPEAFLHPDWQSKLADFILFSMNRVSPNYSYPSINFLIETHSVFIIQRLQILIGEGKLDKEIIKVMYFNNETEEKKYYEMRLRDDGIFIDKFGDGFYDEIARNSLKILGLERKN